MLTFAIPTWKRPIELERCVRSIASQVKAGMPARIHIGDDCSEPPVVAVIEKLKAEYPFITSHRNPKRIDYSTAFHALYTQPIIKESDWVWTFGDDDLLEAGALKFMLGELEKTTVDYYHVAEVSRASGKNSAFAGTLFDLCCQFGWLEMTGFITATIVRGPLLHAAGSSHLWPHFAISSYVQSLALLQVLHDRPAIFLDIPLIRTQQPVQTEDTQAQWAADRIAERYLDVVSGLKMLYTEKILTKKVPKKFFRYLVYHLWDRHLTFMVQDYVTQRRMWDIETWSKIRAMGEFLADEKDRAELIQDVDTVQALLSAHVVGMQWMDGIVNQALGIAHRRNAEVYTFGYNAPGSGRPFVHGEAGVRASVVDNEPTSSPLPSPSPES